MDGSSEELKLFQPTLRYLRERRVKTCAIQTPVPQVKGSHTAVGVTAVHARPATAVCADLPRPERHGGVSGGGERAFEP
nr:unnamed protein product [Digitaria exilis]